ncbi:MAG: AMP-binding protein [Actinobacteria bacterium]|nr:AMP-binding protein [Actinomycetota bacterium]
MSHLHDTDGLPPLLAGLAATARSAPARPAVVGPGDEQLSFAALHTRVTAVAAGLRTRGLGGGARTVVLVPPGPDFVVAIYGLLAGGGVPVLVDPGIGVRRVARALAAVAQAALIGSTRAHVARRVLRWAPSARHHILTDDVPGLVARACGATDTLADVERDGRHAIANGHAAWTPRADADEAALLFTSGSTGPPKAVVYRHPHFAAQLAALTSRFRLRAAETNVATFPPFALFGPAIGMTTVLPSMDFTRPAAADPRALFALVQRSGADVLFASPALLSVLARYGRAHDCGLPTVRLVLSAGAPVPADVATAMASLLAPEAVVATPYGMTEALPVCTIGGAELRAPADANQPPRGVCIGTPVADTDVMIIAVTDSPIARLSPAHAVATGQVGELVVAGPQVTEAYVDRPAATARAKTTWQGRVAHRTGDLAWCDPHGRLWFCGRTAHRVHTAAGHMDPLPIERLVTGHPAVRRAALVGVGDATTADPVLIVQPEDAVWHRLRPWIPGGRRRRSALVRDLRARLDADDDGARVTQVLLRRRFPVDARHNAKVGYEQLARWAAARRRGRLAWVGRRAFGGAAT